MQKATAIAVSQDTLHAYYKLAALTVLSLAIYMALVTFAFASSNSPMGTILCNVVDMITQGNLGKGLATLGVIVVGVGAAIGKVSWGLAMTVAVGIAVTIRAPDVLTALQVGGGSC